MFTGARLMKRMTVCGTLLLAGLAVAACGLDLSDPNNPTEDEVFDDPLNLLSVGVGIQAEMAELIGPYIFSTSLATDEMGAGTGTFPNFKNADAGQELETGQFLNEEPWARAYRVVKLADDLLTAVPTANLQPDTKSGLIALAKFAKGMSFGILATLFPQAPIDVGLDNIAAPFVDRTAVLAEAISLLESARADLLATPPSAEFNSAVPAEGFDLAPTIDALLARYNLMAGNYEAAASAAVRVPAMARSEFRFSATDRNSVNNIVYNSGNPYQIRARQELRLGAETGDQRVGFWVVPATFQGENFVLDELNVYQTAEAAFPIFLPDEMTLIRAEAAARTGDLATARTLINEVRTQCGVTTEPAACLPALTAAQLPTEDAVLSEILRQRRYELFLQGLRFDDLRRFDATRKYDFLPLPQSECDRNPAAPC
jgi:starch-binding outer membrane protein, SusD/RagB family